MKNLNAETFKGMIESGANNLSNYEKEINTLNVFPVPDGDTGTNMYLTFNNGSKEANNALSNSIGDVAKSLSKGLLMGARGNSGVITSQIFRGFSKYSAEKFELSPKEVAEGFLEGARTAYKAIMKPVEGTILTVIREAAWYAHHDFESNPNIDLNEYFTNLVKYAKESLDFTPNLLPALKEAGVVDSGGAGLCRILEGFKAYLDGTPIIRKEGGVLLVDEDKEYIGYRVELTLRLNKQYEKNDYKDIIINRLKEVGENINLNIENKKIDLTINTLKPGEILNILQRYGEFVTIKIDSNIIPEKTKQEEKSLKEYGIITVASGKGLSDLFKSLGVDIVIEGGQTMNPSCQDFMEKIDELDNCKCIFVLPNNSNIIMAADQARELSNKDVIIIPSKSIQAGISALALFDQTADKLTNEKNLVNAIKNVKTAQITYAVKDTSFDGVEVKKGDYIALENKTILASSKDLEKICLYTIDSLSKNDGEILTIVTGEDANQEITNKLVKYIEETNKFEVEVIEGNQPVYSYLFGLE